MGQADVVLWIVDGNNVMGSRPDGWWHDRAGAARRLATQVDAWQRDHADPVLLLFDGRPDPDTVALARDGLEVAFAPRPGRDAADDAIVEAVGERFAAEAALVVVTADRGLVERLPPGVSIEGPRRFLERLG